MFAVGDTSCNIRDYSAFSANDFSAQIAKHVFGVAALPERSCDFGIAAQGFSITSLQFSLHYYFKNKKTAHQLMRNISECTKLNGYFIGACYDGRTIFDLLQNCATLTIEEKKTKLPMMKIAKLYTQTSFPSSEPCLGYAIDVWQESINRSVVEYLVNFDYLTKLLHNYGFAPLTKLDAASIGFGGATDSFKELFQQMQTAKTAVHGKPLTMCLEEQRISFLNRCFIFQKVAHVQNTHLVQEKMNDLDDERDLAQREVDLEIQRQRQDALQQQVERQREIDRKKLQRKKELAEQRLEQQPQEQQALSEQELLEQALSEQALSEQPLVERELSEQALSEQALSEQVLLEQELSEPEQELSEPEQEREQEPEPEPEQEPEQEPELSDESEEPARVRL